MRATIEAIENDLVHDGLVRRYRSRKFDDGLPPGEGTFFLCTFWLAQCLLLLGRYEAAEALFARAVELRNDVGLLSEQYSVSRKRLVGNFPQALSHVAFATTAAALTRSQGTR
jgi:GH15 family glucan-1,4-alpha-glucosidase